MNFLSKKNQWLLGLYSAVFVILCYLSPGVHLLSAEIIGYLPVHTFMEIFSIVVSTLIFTISWVEVGRVRLLNIVVVSAIFFAVAFIDLAHALSYPGMPDFISQSGPEKAIFFWLCGRFLVAIGMLYLVVSNVKVLTSKITWRSLSLPFGVVAVVYWLGLYHVDIFPRTFIDGEGLTSFKIFSEATIVLILIISAIVVIRRKNILSKFYDLENISMAIFVTILSESYFMLYAEVTDLYNFAGHVYKVIAYYFIYKAFFREIFMKPYTELDQKNKELELAKKAAVAASVAKSQFLANMSHEIRTPMSSILGMAELIEETNLTKDQSRYVQILKGAGDHLLKLINDILDLSRIESGFIEMNNKQFDLPAEFFRVQELLQETARKKKIELKLKLSSDLPKLAVGDVNKFSQVLINIMGNAIKFADKGMVELDAHVNKKTDSEVEIQVSVADSGPGIPAEKIPLLFQNFSQLDDSITRKHGGTGLGLAISKKLVEVMNGKIWVESEPGRGSTFFFTVKFKLPVSNNLLKPEIVQKTEPTFDAATSEVFNILHAEDIEDNRNLIGFYLKDSNYIIDYAENGEIALSKFKKNKYALIIMDLQMPVMNGYDAIREIRKYEKEMNMKSIPIIALTANAFKEDEERCMKAGSTAYLSKPVRKYVLLNELKRLII